MKAHEIAGKAAEIVAGDRQKQHGDKLENHQNIADLWAAWLGVEVTPSDVAAMMTLLKLARTKTGAFNIDDFVDAVGYASIMGELHGRTEA